MDDPRVLVRQNDIEEYQKLFADVKLAGWLWNEKLSKYEQCEVSPFQFTRLSSNLSRGRIPMGWDLFDEKTPPARILCYHDESNPALCYVVQSPDAFFCEEFNMKASVLSLPLPSSNTWSDKLLKKIHGARSKLSCKDIDSFGGVWPATLILSGSQLVTLEAFGQKNVIIRGLYFSSSGKKWKELDLYPSQYNYRVTSTSDLLYEATANLAYEHSF
jgi:hypothetical protein